MAVSKKARKSLLPALAAVGLVFISSVPALAAGHQIVDKTRPAAVAQLAPAGRVSAEKHLRLAIGLPLRNPAELDQLLQQLYDPASPSFHQWLTPDQLADRFGATDQDCQAVRDWATAHGLSVSATHPNKLVIDIEGAAGDIEAALNVRLRIYNHPTENRTFFAPDAEPTLDLAVPILTISGLDDFVIPRPMHRIKPLDSPGAITPRGGSGPSGSYMGGDFRAAYVPGTTLNGAGQTVGLLQFDGFYNNDILNYESQASLPNVPLTVVPIDGGVSTPGSGNSEVCLDIEMVISMAPGLSRVYVYEAPNPSPWVDLLSRMQTDNLSKQLSCSWGGGSPNSSAENIFKLMSAQGQSFYNATGDSDAFVSAIPFPSDSTNITQVGGTTLTTTGPLGSYVSEKAWNWGLVQGSYTGTSGGVSTYYRIPSYQVPVSMAVNQGSTTMRNVPDVALTGDNVYVRYNNGSAAAFGGTSCAAPLWAGFTALVNQQAAANSLNPIGFMNPPVYNIGLGANYLSNFHDTTTGNNTWSSSPTKYYATNGYDLCTGWGTPTINLINTLAGPAAPSLASNSLALSTETCVNSAVDPGETVTMNFGLINNGGVATTNLVATLQAAGGVTAPSGPQTYGALASGGGASARAFTFTANGSCGGTVTASLQLLDGSKDLGTVLFSIPLGVLTAGSPLNQSFDSVATPGLPSGWSTVVISGGQANWVTTTASSYSAPNAAFVTDSPTLGENALVSPVFPIGSTSAQLSFRHNYNLEFRSHGGSTTYYDGGVLEISIGGGAFTDILSAGGSFVSGGYNGTLSSGNAIGARQAWGGNSGGWVSTTVNLPASAAGQNVQLRWACAVDSDNANGGVGWYVDSISITDTFLVCCTGNTAPTFTGQPTNQTVVTAGNTSFTVAASGSPAPTYQWYFNGTNLLAGKTTATLSLSNVQPNQAGGYSAVASNVAGLATSSIAQLTVLVPPSITGQPTNQTVIIGSNAAFNVTATGTAPLGYQWRLFGTNLNGATTSSLSLLNAQPAQAGPYTVVVSNTAGMATSSVAQLTVLVPPSITGQPTNQTVIAGSNATFNVTATGTAPLGYQWRLFGTNLGGATTSSLSLPNAQPAQAGAYTVIVSNTAGMATSSVAQLTVLVPPSITGQPTNQTVIAGSNATFNASATGTAPLGYQWRLFGTNLGGATTSSLSLPNAQPAQAGPYTVIVSNTAGMATSSVAQLTVLVPPSITGQPTNQTVIAGSNATFNVSATGTAPLDYQWRLFGTNLSGATTSSLSLPNAQLAQAGPYTVVVSNVAGMATSSVAQLTVVVPPSITAEPTNQTVIAGSNATFNVTATGTAPLDYQWRLFGTNLNGATTSSLSLPNAQPAQAGPYTVVVSNVAGMATSSVAQLTVLVPPSITGQPTNQTVIAGSNATFNVTATGTAPLDYQWRLFGTNLNGATTSSLSLPNAQPAQAGPYTVVVSNTAGMATSSVAQLTVLVPPSISTQPVTQTVLPGTNVTFSITAIGSAPLAYQWQFAGSNLNGSTASTLSLSNVQAVDAGPYSVIVSNAAGMVTSSTANLRILVAPTISDLTRSGSTASISFQSLNGLDYTLEYKDSFDDSAWTLLPPASTGTGALLILQDTNSPPESRFYRVRCE